MLHCSAKNKGCGGCPLLFCSYSEQLQHKQKTVASLLGDFGQVQPILGMKEPFYYRNKAISTFSRKDGKLASGIYKQGSHQVIPVEKCLLHHPDLDTAIDAVRQAARACHYEPFDEDRRTGLLRHVLVRQSRSSGQILVVLITATSILPGSKAFVSRLRALCPQVSSVVQNINPRYSSAVLGPSQKVLYGKGWIEDSLCGVRFQLSASSFYQINPEQTEVLYRTAIQMANPDKSQTILDAYCGVGTIGLIASKSVGHVIGVESNRQAVSCAVQNARANQIKNARFHCADASFFLQRMAAQKEYVDIVFLDPPRSGSTEEFLDALCRLSPQKVVYISCNPQTQQRDLAFLCERGWHVQEIQPVDLFPHTEHIETVVLLSKLNTKQHIEVELNLDELDLTSAESKATYEEIKAYVLEHTGLKVSHLYIAQVKQKYDIIERENYNKPKSENAKQPKCPPEKEAAITEALKFFGMI